MAAGLTSSGAKAKHKKGGEGVTPQHEGKQQT